jgi:phenylalanyl-tRNA synthetase beta chain
MHDDEQIGIIGEIHPIVLQHYNIKDPTCAFELDLEVLYKLTENTKTLKEIARFPSVERDIALLLNLDISADNVLEVIRKAEKDILQNILIFDVYTGKQVPEGYKSMALKLTFQSHENTLTDADVNTSIDKILNDLQTELRAVLR